jgi:hypothetical protein
MSYLLICMDATDNIIYFFLADIKSTLRESHQTQICGNAAKKSSLL